MLNCGLGGDRVGDGLRFDLLEILVANRYSGVWGSRCGERGGFDD